MSVGDVGRWRDSVGGQIPGTSYGSFNFATQERNDNNIYTKFDDATIEFDEAGIYLLRWTIQQDDSSNNRTNGKTRAIQAVGSGDFFSTHDTGYSRNSGNRVYTKGGRAFIVAAANDRVTIQDIRDTDAPTGGSLVNLSFLEVVKLADTGGLDYGIYEQSTGNQAYGGTTPNDVAFDAAAVETDTTSIELQAGNTNIRLKRDNARYWVFYSISGDGGGSRTQRVSRAVTGSTLIPGSGNYGYQRNASNEYCAPSGEFMHEVSTADEDVSIQVWRGDGVAAGQGGASVDGSWNTIASEVTCLVIDMPDSWNSAAFYDSTGGQNMCGGVSTALNTCRDTLWADSPFSKSTDALAVTSSAIDAWITGSTVTARQNVASGARGTAGLTVRIDGVNQTRGEYKEYTRGNQGTQDTFGGGWLCGGIYTLAASDTIGLQSLDRGDNGADDDTRANYTALFLVDINSMGGGGGGPDVTASGTPTLPMATASGVAKAVRKAVGGGGSVPEVISTLDYDPGSNTVTPANQNITVPADCTAVYFFGGGWDGTGVFGAYFETISLGGNAPDQSYNPTQQIEQEQHRCIAAWYQGGNLPGTGSQAFAIDMSGNKGVWDEGALGIFVFVKGGDLTAWRTVQDDAPSSGFPQITFTAGQSSDTDLILIGENTFADPQTQPGVPYTVEESNGRIRSNTIGVWSRTGSDSSITFTAGNSTGYTCCVGISIPAAPGGAVLPMATAAGTATVVSGETASGAPTLPIVTAAGTAKVVKTASGSPTLPSAVASGSAAVGSTTTANGAASTPMATAAGTAKVRKTASDGSPVLPMATASGTAAIRKTANGGPETPSLIAAGAALVRRKASGAVTLPMATANGLATVGAVTVASGSATLPIAVASGTAEVTRSASGSATLPSLVASGAAKVRRVGNGSPTLPMAVASGAAFVSTVTSASGSAVLPSLEASGTAKVTRKASGSVSLPMAVASGAAQAGQIKTSSGNAVLPSPVASGTAIVARQASGDAQTPILSASGTATVARQPFGAVTLPSPIAAGTAKVRRIASGAAILPMATASGLGRIGYKVSGAAVLPSPIASGTALVGGIVVVSTFETIGYTIEATFNGYTIDQSFTGYVLPDLTVDGIDADVTFSGYVIDLTFTGRVV